MRSNILFACALMSASVNAFIDWGPCAGTPMPMGKFNQTKFSMGEWYEIYRDKDVWFHQESQCSHITFAANVDGWFSDLLMNR